MILMQQMLILILPILMVICVWVLEMILVMVFYCLVVMVEVLLLKILPIQWLVFTIDTSDNERFRINSVGNVGIGTENPDTLLNLFGTGNTTIKVHNNSATAGTYSRLQFITGGPGSSVSV